MIFSIIFCSISIESNAEVVAGASKFVSIVYDDSNSSVWIGNTYLPWNWNVNTSAYDENDDEAAVFWYKGKQSLLFQSEAEYYGYQVKVVRNVKTAVTYNNCDIGFWCVGTAGQLLNGENRGGILDSSSFTVWVPTNNSVQAVHMAPFFHFKTSWDNWEDNGEIIDGGYGGKYDIRCQYTVTYTGYKTAEAYQSAMSSIQNELEHQTTEMEEQTQLQQDQLTEMEDQTEQLEEQTETQKGMLSKMTDFFGSFFDNLVDSVIGLFVPSKEDMADLFNRLNDFFSETFGFLYYPFDVFFEIINSLITADYTSVQFTFPTFSIMGYKVWDNIKFSFNDYPLTKQIFTYVRQGTGVIIVFSFIDYLRKFFDKRFGGGGN